MLLVGRVLGKRPDADRDGRSAASIASASMLVITDPGEHARRSARLRRAGDRPDGAHRRAARARRRARGVSGEEGQTDAERQHRPAGGHPHLPHAGVGGRRRPPAPPQDHVRRWRPHHLRARSDPTRSSTCCCPRRAVTSSTIDQSFTWEQYAQMPPAEQPVGAYYTRACLAARGRRARHADRAPRRRPRVRAGPRGPRRGDPVALWGPRTVVPPPGRHRLAPARRRRDRAAGRRRDPRAAAGRDAGASCVAEVADEHERQELPARAGVEVTWLLPRRRRGRHDDAAARRRAALDLARRGRPTSGAAARAGR